MRPAPTDYRGNPSWPASMPGTADGTSQAGVRSQAQALLDEQSKTDPRDAFTAVQTQLAPPELNAADGVQNRVANIRQHTLAGVARLDKIAADDTLPEPARQRLRREAAVETRKAVEEAVTEGESFAAMLDTMLLDAVQPAFPEHADRAEAREELRMLLDASADPATTLTQLATGNDARLASLAMSPYAQTYLRAKGFDERVIREIVAATRVQVAQAALNPRRPVDDRRRAAAQALLRVPDLRKQLRLVHTAASFVLPEA